MISIMNFEKIGGTDMNKNSEPSISKNGHIELKNSKLLLYPLIKKYLESTSCQLELNSEC